jgi:hypothetical protein
MLASKTFERTTSRRAKKRSRRTSQFQAVWFSISFSDQHRISGSTMPATPSPNSQDYFYVEHGWMEHTRFFYPQRPRYLFSRKFMISSLSRTSNSQETREKKKPTKQAPQQGNFVRKLATMQQVFFYNLLATPSGGDDATHCLGIGLGGVKPRRACHESRRQVHQ